MTETNTLPRMRGIKQAITEIKSLDPKTALTEKGLRRLILTGTIPHVKMGTKYLINMDVLSKYLYDGNAERNSETGGAIRIIKE